MGVDGEHRRDGDPAGWRLCQGLACALQLVGLISMIGPCIRTIEVVVWYGIYPSTDYATSHIAIHSSSDRDDICIATAEISPFD